MRRTRTPEERARIAARFREIAADLERRQVGNWQARADFFARHADELDAQHTHRS